MNIVVLIGRLVTDCELKYTPSGVAVASTRIAVNRKQKGDDGKYLSDFFDLVLWKQTAEYATQYLGKGRMVSVAGRLQQQTWTQADGQKRSKVEIVVNEIGGLDKPKNQTEQPEADYNPEEWQS